MPGSINSIDNKTTDSSFFVEDTDNAATTSTLDMRKSRLGGIITNGDTIGNVRFMGFDGATYQVGARIYGVTDGTIGAGRMPTDLFFNTSPNLVSGDLLRMQIAAAGNVTIFAPDSGIGLTIGAGGEVISSGDLNIVSGNIFMANSDPGAAFGIYWMGGIPFMANWGTNNVFLGASAGNAALTFGTDNVGVGELALSDIKTGSRNVSVGSNAGLASSSTDDSVFVGYQAGTAVTTGPNNVAVGSQALQTCITNINNVAIGYQTLAACVSDNNTGLGVQALRFLTTGARNIGLGPAAAFALLTGNDNIAIGFQSGQNYTGAESNNIVISGSGVTGDANTIRIGTQGSGSRQQNLCYIAGITGVSVSNLALVSIDTVTGQLGSTSGGSSFLNALNGDTGTATPSSGTITIAGGVGITTSAASSTVTIDLDAPVSIANGGTNAISFTTTDGTIYFDGTSLVTTTTGSSGDVLTSNGIGVAPTYQAISASGAITTINGNSGSVTPTLGAVTISGGNNITSSGSGSTLTVNVSGTTDHALQLGNATNSLSSLVLGLAGQLLQSAGAGVDPAWTTSTYPSTNAQGDLIYGSALNTFSTLVKDTNATRYLANTGTTNNPKWDQVALSTGVTGVLPIANGGTNASSFVTTDGTVYYDGTSLVTTTTGTSGQVLTSNGVGLAPTYQAVSASGGITTINGNSGSVTPTLGVVTISGGNNITTSGSGSTLTVNVSGTTNHTVQIGNATNSLTSIATGSSGQLLQSAGSSADPAWTTSTYPATNAQGDLIYGSASNVFSTLAKDTNATRYLSNTGTTNNPAWAQIDLSNGVTGILPIANGGTFASSFTTTDGTVYYDGTRLVTTTTGSSGQVLTSNGIGLAPTYQAVGSSAFPWTVVTGATQAIAVNNGYIANNSGTCVMTLPATAAVGDLVRVTGINNATGWKIAQNSGQTIYFGDSPTTTGATGFLASSLTRDSVELVCVVANNDWNVLSAQGNIQVS